MKKCSKCGLDLNLDNFHSNGKGGLRSSCKDCVNKSVAKYKANNTEKVALKDKRYRQANLSSRRAYGREHYRLNKSSYAYAEAKRRASKQLATPTWLTTKQKEDIKQLYWLAQDLYRTVGEKYQVDHIIPLQNDLVCGLHVSWNLQILPEDQNYAKSNCFSTAW